MRKSFHTATDTLWFTADLHFGHKAMIRPDVCGRPWPDVDQMDAAIIENWNRTVGERDHVFVLGDVSFRKLDETLAILCQLNGTMYLISGNHDSKLLNNPGCSFLGGVAPYHEIDVDSQRIVLCHYAFRTWNKSHYGSWNLHGHSHGSMAPQGKQMDVGIDAVAARGLKIPEAYAPISFGAVELMMKTAPFVAVDHHTQKRNETAN